MQYLISKKLITSIEIDEVLSIVEFFNSSRNKIIKIKLKKGVIFLKQFIDENKGFALENFSTENICSVKYLELESLIADFDNLILIYIFSEDYEIYDRKIPSYEGKALISGIASKLFEIHDNKVSIQNLDNLKILKPKILDSDNLENYLNEIKTDIFYSKDIVHKLKLDLENIESISDFWKADDSIVHGDFKIENIIKYNDKIEVIDWELAFIGDRIWDLATFLFNLYRYKFYFRQETSSISTSVELARMFMDQYFVKDISRNKDYFYKKTLSFFFLKFCEEFLLSVKGKRWTNEKIHLEYQRLLKFWPVLSNIKKSEFNYINYL